VLRRDQLIWSLYSVLGGSIVLGLVYVGPKGGTGDAVLATLAVAVTALTSKGQKQYSDDAERSRAPRPLHHLLAAPGRPEGQSAPAWR
jgi:hypothetical protein